MPPLKCQNHTFPIHWTLILPPPLERNLKFSNPLHLPLLLSLPFPFSLFFSFTWLTLASIYLSASNLFPTSCSKKQTFTLRVGWGDEGTPSSILLYYFSSSSNLTFLNGYSEAYNVCRLNFPLLLWWGDTIWGTLWGLTSYIKPQLQGRMLVDDLHSSSGLLAQVLCWGSHLFCCDASTHAGYSVSGDSSAHTCALHIGHRGPEHRLRSLATADQRSHTVSKPGVSYDRGAGTTVGTWGNWASKSCSHVWKVHNFLPLSHSPCSVTTPLGSHLSWGHWIVSFWSYCKYCFSEYQCAFIFLNESFCVPRTDS